MRPEYSKRFGLAGRSEAKRNRIQLVGEIASLAAGNRPGMVARGVPMRPSTCRPMDWPVRVAGHSASWICPACSVAPRRTSCTLSSTAVA